MLRLMSKLVRVTEAALLNDTPTSISNTSSRINRTRSTYIEMDDQFKTDTAWCEAHSHPT